MKLIKINCKDNKHSSNSDMPEIFLLQCYDSLNKWLVLVFCPYKVTATCNIDIIVVDPILIPR